LDDHGVVSGCMDPGADNYNAAANNDDGSCITTPPNPHDNFDALEENRITKIVKRVISEQLNNRINNKIKF